MLTMILCAGFSENRADTESEAREFEEEVLWKEESLRDGLL